MTQFKALDPKTEIIGEAVLSFVEGMTVFRERAYKMLASHGIEDPKPGKWFSQQAFLNALQEIYQSAGPNTLFLIGKKAPDNVKLTEEAARETPTFERIFNNLDIGYHLNHRNGEAGHYLYNKTGEKQAELVSNTPYPCEFDKGLVEGFAQKFKPAGALFVKVKHDESGCRKDGKATCTYHLSW